MARVEKMVHVVALGQRARCRVLHGPDLDTDLSGKCEHVMVPFELSHVFRVAARLDFFHRESMLLRG